MHNTALAVGLLGALTLTACSTSGWKEEFACPGMPNGVTCKSVQEVYNGTENADRMLTDEQGLAKEKSASTQSAPVFLPGQLPAGRRMPADALPILEPARVMRIWVAPWIDDKKDLHFPGYIFTEVTPRRWSMGEASAIKGKVLVPLQTDYHDRQADEEATEIGEAAKVMNPKNLIPGKGPLDRMLGNGSSNSR